MPVADESKEIHIEFPNGRIYSVPALVVAEDMASYYAGKEMEDNQSDRTYDKVFNEEKERALSDNYILKDWVSNNMNWSDLEDDAEIIEEGQFDPSQQFLEADKRVKEP
jgi:hypothetical protein